MHFQHVKVHLEEWLKSEQTYAASAKQSQDNAKLHYEQAKNVLGNISCNDVNSEEFTEKMEEWLQIVRTPGNAYSSSGKELAPSTCQVS